MCITHELPKLAIIVKTFTTSSIQNAHNVRRQKVLYMTNGPIVLRITYLGTM